MRKARMKGSIWRLAWSLCLASIAVGTVACSRGMQEFEFDYVQTEKWLKVGPHPEGASAFIDSSGRIVLENWPGALIIEPDIEPEVSILPDSIEAVLYVWSIREEFIIDSLRVRFSGKQGYHRAVIMYGKTFWRREKLTVPYMEFEVSEITAVDE